jgi:hypothetical protein
MLPDFLPITLPMNDLSTIISFLLSFSCVDLIISITTTLLQLQSLMYVSMAMNLGPTMYLLLHQKQITSTFIT